MCKGIDENQVRKANEINSSSYTKCFTEPTQKNLNYT